MLIKSTATSVSVTLDILGTTVLLRSTNANLRLAFTVRSSIAAMLFFFGMNGMITFETTTTEVISRTL